MLARWVEFVVRRPVPVLAVVLLATALLAAQARHLELEMRERNQLPQDHAYVGLYNRINELFGGGAVVVVGVVARGGDVFSRDVLGKIERLTRRIEQIPEVARGPGVLSLAAERVKTIAGDERGLDVRQLMPEVPATDEALAALRHEVLADGFYAGSLVSSDGGAAAIIAEVPPDVGYDGLTRRIEEVVAAERDERVEIVLGGAPVLLSWLDRYTAQMAILFPVAVLLIGLVHYEAFRTVQAMVLPLLTALVSVCWALGFMGLRRLPIDTWSAITPVAILAIAAGHAVQILKRFYEELARTGDRARAVVDSLVAVGPVTIAATLIAVAGFASLATFGVASIQSFGLLMASGILSALVIELSFMPAVRVLLPQPSAREALRERESPWLSAILGRISRQVVEHPARVLAVAGATVALCLVGSASVRVDSSLRGYLAPSTVPRRDDAVLNERFSGTSVLKILIEGEADGAARRPDVLRAMSDLEAFLRSRFPEVRKTLSPADFVRRMHAAMSPEAARGGELPTDERLVAQYLLLYSFSKPDDLSGVVDADYRNAQVVVFCSSDEVGFVHRLVEDTRVFAVQRFAGLPVRVGLPGGAIGAQAAMNEVIVQEKLRNMLQVAAIIVVLSALALRSIVGGLLVLTPLLVAVAVNFGVMGLAGIWLNMSTATISAMAMSIGSDFGIYLVFRLREELRSHALADAVERTLRTSGKAIFFVSSAVAIGYLVLTVSGFRAWVELGGLVALTMVVSSLAVVTVVPALVMVVRPRFLLAGGAAGAAGEQVGSPAEAPRRRSAL